MAYVIIGNGPAGVNAIESIRKLDNENEVILVSREDTLPYSRIMTPEYMAGEVSESELYNREGNFYAQNKVKLMLGQSVTQVIPDMKTIVLDDKLEIGYDRLLIASGSSPVLPPFADLGINGVFTLWDKHDSERISRYLGNVTDAVIVGGGLVGLQAARALSAHGIKVTVVERLDRLMPLQLDGTASRMLLDAAEKIGINVMTGTEVAFLEVENLSVRAVCTNKGRIKADMVLVSTGVRPNLSMVENSGLEKRRGLIVDNQMRTNIPNIYAAGDVAEAPAFLDNENTLRALWLCAVQQGRTAGTNMAGGCDVYKGSIAMNSIELFGLSLISLGMLQGDGIYEKIITDCSNSQYRKLLFKDDNLVGLIFAGDIQQAGILCQKLGEKLCDSSFGNFSCAGAEMMFA